MSILIGLIPALGWGSGPIIANLIGGDPMHQMVGMAYGQALAGIIVYFIFHPSMNASIIIWSFLGGIMWSFAQLNQFEAFKLMNVSSAMPISAGMQLIETPLVGVIFWGDWGPIAAKIAGFIAIIALIIGITLMSFENHATNQENSNKHKAILILLIGSFGFTACDVSSRIPNATGISSILPQTLGRMAGAIIIALFIRIIQNRKYLFAPLALKNTIAGASAGIGTFAYLTSLNLNGVATAFPLTQLNTIVSTFGGIFILNEHKDKKEMTLSIIGLILIIGSAFIIGRLS